MGSPWAGTFQNLMLLVEVDDILSNKTVAKELSYMCNLYPTDEWYLSLITVVYYICVFLSQSPGESCPCKVLLFLNLFSVSICDESTIIGPHMRSTIIGPHMRSTIIGHHMRSTIIGAHIRSTIIEPNILGSQLSDHTLGPQ